MPFQRQMEKKYKDEQETIFTHIYFLFIIILYFSHSISTYYCFEIFKYGKRISNIQ